MPWNGIAIKNRAKEIKKTLTVLAQNMNVSRMAIDNWIKRQIPKGGHLLGLCKELNVSVDYFFTENEPLPISVPLHRTKKKARVTNMTHDLSISLAKEYIKLFKNASSPGIVPVLRIKEKNNEQARSLASYLRECSEVRENEPIKYTDTFKLLDKLGIVTIFRSFPAQLRDYAFYCKIYNYRVVFVNKNTNILDLIFPLLHEAVHAIRDEASVIDNALYGDDEEKFCDRVANDIQFPDGYVSEVSLKIGTKKGGAVVNILKEIASDNGHSLYGLAKRLQERGNTLPDIGGADTNLKKGFPDIGKIMNNSGSPIDYIKMLHALSPLFFKILRENLSNSSARQFGEWLEIDNSIDANELKKTFIEYVEHYL